GAGGTPDEKGAWCGHLRRPGSKLVLVRAREALRGPDFPAEARALGHRRWRSHQPVRRGGGALALMVAPLSAAAACSRTITPFWPRRPLPQRRPPQRPRPRRNAPGRRKRSRVPTLWAW